MPYETERQPRRGKTYGLHPVSLAKANETYAQRRIGYRRVWARYAEDHLDMVLPKNEREWKFCAVYVREVVNRLKTGERLTRALQREASATALREAGYREKRAHTIALRAAEQLSLPRTQRGIMEMLAKVGVDVAKCGTVLAEVMNEGTHADKLRAVELYFKTTIGFAPVKAANLHAEVPVDAFFNEKAFERTPPIKTVSSAEVPKHRRSARKA